MKLPFYAIIENTVIKITNFRHKWYGGYYVGNIVGQKFKHKFKKEDLQKKVPKNQALMELLYGKSDDRLSKHSTTKKSRSTRKQSTDKQEKVGKNAKRYRSA